jgi:hypothetical protein
MTSSAHQSSDGVRSSQLADDMSEPADGLVLTLLPQSFAICRLQPGDTPPSMPLDTDVWSVTRMPDELSIVVVEDQVPDTWTAEPGWRCLRVRGPLDFALVGVLASLTAALASWEVPVFALSTFSTDCLLVRAADLERASQALRAHGHKVDECP